jgi:hypothetical protein
MTMATAAGEGAMRGHHGEVFCTVIIPEEFEGESDPGVFSITVVGRIGGVVAIRDAALVDVGTEEPLGSFDGFFDGWMINPKLLGEGDKVKATVPSGIEGSIAWVHFIELSTIEGWEGKGMPPTSASTLSHCGLNGILP